ncbi:MAG: cation transporter [Clostridia bacterium]|nr:cation transporter [Clostridia bacterium]
MEKTITVSGMMCSRCEAHVKNALEALHGVESAIPDRVSGTVKLVLSDNIGDEELKNAVEAAGYALG